MFGKMFNMNNNDEEKPKSKTKEAAGQAVKTLWKKIPFIVKLQILGGLVEVFFLLICISAVVSLNPLNFLFYSDNVQNENKEVEEAYEEFWDELFNEDSKDCNEEQKKAA